MTTAPPSWIISPFTDVFDIQGGTQPPKSTFHYSPLPNYVRLLQIRDFGDRPVPTYIPNRPSLKLCSKGDILIGRYGASVGRICTGMDGAYNVALAKVIIPDAMDRRFVFWLLRSPVFQQPILQIERSAQNGFNKNDLAVISVPLPPLAEQRRVVERLEDVIGHVSLARDHLSRVPPILKRFRQAVLAAACSGNLTDDWRERQKITDSSEVLLARVLVERKQEFETRCAKAKAKGQRIPPQPDDLEQMEFSLPESLELPEMAGEWTWVSVNDVVSIAQYGTSVKADGSAERGVPLLRMGNIQDGRIDMTDLQWIKRQSENIPDFRLDKGDVLFNRTNSPELVGKTAVYDSELEAVFASYLIRVRCDARIALGEYLSSWLNSPWGRWWARTVRTDGVSQSNINATKLRSMPLPLPPLQEQIEIVRRINALFALAANIEESVEAAKRRTKLLSQAILAKAFRGELVPTEAELARREGRDYEPASVLLERIARQRANDGSTKSKRHSHE